MHLVGFTIEIYYDAKSYESQDTNFFFFDHRTSRFFHFTSKLARKCNTAVQIHLLVVIILESALCLPSPSGVASTCQRAVY